MSSRLSRLYKLGTSVSKVVGEQLLSTIDGAKRAKAIADLVKTLGQMKGAAMKLGQMISITQDLFLPPEIVALFTQLQRSAPPMSEEDVRFVFQRSFQKKPEEVFVQFDYKSIASASIGQVHLARLESGEQVAVKIQYPDIAEAIQGDFKNLQLLKNALITFIPNAPKIDEILEELQQNILAECDYLREAENIATFRKNYDGHSDKLVIPKVYDSYTTKHILTMEYLSGCTFEETLNWTQSKKNNLAEMLYAIHADGFFNIGLLHTDPQNGNYLFQENKIVLLDFGSIREFPIEFRTKIFTVFNAIEKSDVQAYQTALLELKVFEDSDSYELFERHLAMMRKILSPFLTPGPAKFSKQNPFELAREFVSTLSLKGRRTPRKEFALYDRANIGIYTKMKAWDAEIDFRQILLDNRARFEAKLKINDSEKEVL